MTLISASEAPSPSTRVLTLILSLILFSQGQVEPTARWNHFPKIWGAAQVGVPPALGGQPVSKSVPRRQVAQGGGPTPRHPEASQS